MKQKIPKHVQLSEWIRKQIISEKFKSGERILSENELAAQFNLSRQTVRLSIANLEREGLLIRVRGSGTFVKSAPPKFKQKTLTIGVIITYLDECVFPPIICGIESVLSKNGYSMTFGITYNKIENEARALDKMIRAGVDGLIVEATKSALPNPNLSIYRQFKARQIPIVFINGLYNSLGDSYVVLDDIQGGKLACDELLKNGHTKIGGIFKSDDMQGHKRYEGFIEKMFEKSLVVKDSAVIWYTTEDYGYLFDGEFDSVILRRLADLTALVCYNDQIAAKIIELLRRCGKRVPEDLSVVSFDNSSLASESLYNLTSIIYPNYEIGQVSAEGLLESMNKPGHRITRKFPAQLVVRSSIKKLI